LLRQVSIFLQRFLRVVDDRVERIDDPLVEALQRRYALLGFELR